MLVPLRLVSDLLIQNILKPFNHSYDYPYINSIVFDQLVKNNHKWISLAHSGWNFAQLDTSIVFEEKYPLIFITLGKQ
jgi:hypothetical protein